MRTLLIDRNYMALSIVSINKAIKLLVKGKAERVPGYESSQVQIKTCTGVFSVPSVIRLVNDIPWRAHNSHIRFSRKNVLARDNYQCCYCGVKLGKHSRTIDHVIPRSKKGPSSYLNCVSSCKACNNKKSDRTPEEAGMKLLSVPKKPTFAMMYRRHLEHHCREEWSDYIIGA